MLNLIHILFTQLAARLRDEDGEVSVEYALVGGLVAAAIVGGMAIFGPAVIAWFTGIAGDVTAALP